MQFVCHSHKTMTVGVSGLFVCFLLGNRVYSFIIVLIQVDDNQ